MLLFNPITIDSVKDLLAFVKHIPARSCDYTPGNLIMWALYMRYRYTIVNNTLFISGTSQADMQQKAFLMPVGEMPLKDSIEILKQFSAEIGRELQLTAVPEPYIEELKELLPNHRVELLDGWADYIYSASSMVTMQGRSLNKRRNRLNKFLAEYPNHEYSRCKAEDIPDIISFLQNASDCHDQTIMRCYEQGQCISTVNNLAHYPQEAGIIRIDGKIVAFTLGEVFDDTMYVHIEKALREYPGLGEAITKYFATDICTEYPQITVINREEDLGDPGLRQAKRAYNPTEMLNRYEFIPK